MAYGSLAGVGALVPQFSGADGAFTATTRPAPATVTAWLASVNAMLDSMLASEGFSVPVTDADVTPLLDLFVNEEVAGLVNGINGSGRFGPTTKGKDKGGRFAMISEDVREFVKAQAFGFEAMGATRTSHTASGVGYRDTDERGNDTFPIFQRGAPGRTFTDWDR